MLLNIQRMATTHKSSFNLIAILGLVALGFYMLSPRSSDPAIDAPLDLEFTSIEGNQVNLHDLKGKVVLIDFWATWCAPCREEMPKVVAAYEKLHDRGFEILGISLDQAPKEVREFAEKHGMPWEQCCSEGGANPIARRFHIDAIPTMWLVNRNGLLVTTDARGHLEQEVERLLNE